MLTNANLIDQRLTNQHLTGPGLEKAGDVVAWLGAVQAQDYTGAKWAVGQRMQAADDGVLEQAFAQGEILRTHVMRPTWHFVAPADIRWLLALTAPRVNAVNAYMYRKLELDEALFGRSNEVIAAALQGGRQLTRSEIGDVLARAGIKAAGMRLGYILHRAELDAVICSGGRHGKQFTYALLHERAPQAKTLSHDEALAELTKRYFTSHGPAQVQDFAWWSGLTKTEAAAGLAMLEGQLISETIDDQTYWLVPAASVVKPAGPTAWLLPNYDEYLISYRNSGPVLNPAHVQLIEKSNPLFAHFIVIDGCMIGTWRREFKKDTVIITLNPFEPFSDVQCAAVYHQALRYGQFLGMTAEVRLTADRKLPGQPLSHPGSDQLSGL